MTIRVLDGTSGTGARLGGRIVSRASNVTVVSYRTKRIFCCGTISFAARSVHRRPLGVFAINIHSDVAVVRVFHSTFGLIGITSMGVIR